jgi:hypothetical protein
LQQSREKLAERVERLCLLSFAAVLDVDSSDLALDHVIQALIAIAVHFSNRARTLIRRSTAARSAASAV